MQRDPKGWAVVQLLPSFLGMEPGRLAKEDHAPGKGLLPWPRAGILPLCHHPLALRLPSPTWQVEAWKRSTGLPWHRGWGAQRPPWCSPI